VLPHEIAVIRWQHVDELYNELTQEWTNAPEKSQVPTATDSDITTLTELQSDNNKEGEGESIDGSEGRDVDDGGDEGGGGDSAVEVKVAAASAASTEGLPHFLRFDVVQSPSDHHYLNDTVQVRS
jgi:ubiquitin-conjugating enzyme E2 O